MKKERAAWLLAKIEKIINTVGDHGLETRVWGLFKTLTKYGLIVKPSQKINLRYAQRVQTLLSAALVELTAEDGPPEWIKWELPVQVIMDGSRSDILFDLGESGARGLIFCLRFLLEVSGKKIMQQCPGCEMFFSISGGKQKWCSSACRKRSYRRSWSPEKRKQENEKRDKRRIAEITEMERYWK